MSAPYLVLAWSPACDAAIREVAGFRDRLDRAGWRAGWENAGLQVWVKASRPTDVVWIASRQTLVIGRRHARAAGTAAMRDGGPFDPVRQAHALSEGCWGAYVALIRDAGGEVWAFRDPSGALDALTWRRDRVRVVASGLDDLPATLRPSRLAINWEVVADQLASQAALAWRSALDDVHAILPGDLQRLGGAEAVPIWRPSAFPALERGAEAERAEQLRETVLSTVATLSEGYGRVLTELSGGLDSSIVNAAIGRAGLAPRVCAAVHYVGDRRESDERSWAAAVAEQWGLPLEVAVRPVDTIDPLRDFAPFAQGARPPVGVLDAWRDRDLAARMSAHGAQALFTGMGGDAVFFQMPTAAVVADLWGAAGLRALGHPIVPQTARWLRRSVWSVLAEALSSGGEPAPAGSRRHPWLEDARSARPAKRLQIAGLVAVQRAFGRCRRTDIGDLVHPLMTQPIIEACLQVPSWVLVRGGRDRGLAREAFAALLPADVANRTSKGGLTSLFSRRVAASLDLLRPYLLDGALADAGLLDRNAVEQALHPDRLIWRADGLSLVAVAAVEAWVRHWQAQAPDSPVAPRRRLDRG